MLSVAVGSAGRCLMSVAEKEVCKLLEYGKVVVVVLRVVVVVVDGGVRAGVEVLPKSQLDAAGVRW
jgi:hypothetical protein